MKSGLGLGSLRDRSGRVKQRHAPRRGSRRGASGQVQMGKYPDNYCGILDSGDDLQAATAVWAALNVKGAESLR